MTMYYGAVNVSTDRVDLGDYARLWSKSSAPCEIRGHRANNRVIVSSMNVSCYAAVCRAIMASVVLIRFL